MALPETRYATSNGLYVAYQLTGDGPMDERQAASPGTPAKRTENREIVLGGNVLLLGVC